MEKLKPGDKVTLKPVSLIVTSAPAGGRYACVSGDTAGAVEIVQRSWLTPAAPEPAVMAKVLVGEDGWPAVAQQRPEDARAALRACEVARGRMLSTLDSILADVQEGRLKPADVRRVLLQARDAAEAAVVELDIALRTLTMVEVPLEDSPKS